jgi:hypothetical protein
MTPRVTIVTGRGLEVERDLFASLTPALQDTARLEANRWIKRLRLVSYDGQSMRERFTYRGDSLWWFTELYLHKMRRLDRAVATVLALDALCADESPRRLILTGADDAVREAAHAFGRARQLAIDITAPRPDARPTARESRVFGWTTRVSRLRPTRRPRRARPATVAAFVHTAFWRSAGPVGPGAEGYIGPVLDALVTHLPADGLALVGVGPRRNFRARRWWDPVAPVGSARLPVTPVERFAPIGALREAIALWHERHDLARALVAGDAVRAAAEFRGCDLWPILRRDLENAALLQWPWSARAMDEAAAAIEALDPDVVLTYAEAGGWGRALTLEARRRGVPSVGVQHGFIYRHWLNYLHEPDELQPAGPDRGFPHPDRTLLFDRFAAGHLETAGHLPPASLVVTGSARLDVLTAERAALTEAGRAAARVVTGAFPHQRVALLAAKFTEIQHLLPALIRAVAAEPGVHVAIKAHPAETAEIYTPFIGAAPNLTVVPGDANLAGLLSVADGVITMNSTVAIDALTFGLPVLVVGLPNNLSPFVDAGAMLGAGASEGAIRDGVRALLYDQSLRRQLLDRAGAFLDRYGLHATGDAAERAALAILALTRTCI